MLKTYIIISNPNDRDEIENVIYVLDKKLKTAGNGYYEKGLIHDILKYDTKDIRYLYISETFFISCFIIYFTILYFILKN